MLTEDGPKVLEFNCRFGDPETQPLLMRLQTDLIDIFDAIDQERLDEIELSWDSRTALCLVLATDGYPGDYAKGAPITGTTRSELEDSVQVFHAGTTEQDAQLATSGGRVFGVTALGQTREEARELAYDRAEQIKFDGKVYRGDIGE